MSFIRVEAFPEIACQGDAQWQPWKPSFLSLAPLACCSYNNMD
jgi:hypothetical protein